jgi:ribonuclease HI
LHEEKGCVGSACVVWTSVKCTWTDVATKCSQATTSAVWKLRGVELALWYAVKPGSEVDALECQFVRGICQRLLRESRRFCPSTGLAHESEVEVEIVHAIYEALEALPTDNGRLALDYCPAHGSIHGNERADEKADDTTKEALRGLSVCKIYREIH